VGHDPNNDADAVAVDRSTDQDEKIAPDPLWARLVRDLDVANDWHRDCRPPDPAAPQGEHETASGTEDGCGSG
jgi:hypothetical protein